MKCVFGDRAEVIILDSWENTEYFKEKVGSHCGSGTTLIIERIHLYNIEYLLGHIHNVHVELIVKARHWSDYKLYRIA